MAAKDDKGDKGTTVVEGSGGVLGENGQETPKIWRHVLQERIKKYREEERSALFKTLEARMRNLNRETVMAGSIRLSLQVLDLCDDHVVEGSECRKFIELWASNNQLQ